MIAHDLMALIAAGLTYGVILIDPTWPFVTWSEKGKGRSAERHYDMMELDAIKALPIAKLAARDCALFLWATWPTMPIWNEVLEAWGFKYSGIGFLWVKLTPKATFIDLEALRHGRTGHGLHWGMGYGTRANTEPCLFARRGEPHRVAKNVHSVVIAPVREHSRKPDEVHERIERLFPGPYLELFARRVVPGWTVWGNEILPTELRPATSPVETWDEMWRRPFDFSKLDESAPGPKAPPDDDYPELPPSLRRGEP